MYKNLLKNKYFKIVLIFFSFINNYYYYYLFNYLFIILFKIFFNLLCAHLNSKNLKNILH